MTVIRYASPEDGAAIARFQIAMALETENKQLESGIVQSGVTAVMEDPSRGRYLVAATEDGQVVASLLITYEWSDWRDSNMWYIQSVYVQPSHRRQGIFRRMYQEVVQQAANHHVRFVRLYVETDNLPAQQTYEGLGMKRLPYFMYQADLETDPH